MKLRDFFTFAKDKEKKPGTLSDFLLHASDSDKARILLEAASRANDEQMAIFRKSQLKTK